MSPQGPLVSVCIPVYNCGEYIRETISSVTAQSYKNIEIVIVDDGSTDNTKTILNGIKHDRTYIYYQKNSGAAAARNLAYSKSNGKYIKFLDGDDLINPEMIETQVQLAVENPDCIISSKWGRFYGSDLDTFKFSAEDCWQTLSAQQWLCSSWKNGQSMTQPGIFLLPKQIIENAGLWDERLSLIDDLDFFTRIILKSRLVVFDTSAILYYRSGISGSLSDSKEDEAMLSAFRSIDQATANFLAVYLTPETKVACANTWQNFMYTIYPKYPDLAAGAQKKIDELGGSSLEFSAGGVTKILAKLVGWKMTKRIKRFFHQA
jgi:glycosyltransferase involved in cell wall biosynthesis